jgi:hypothetical protein
MRSSREEAAADIARNVTRKIARNVSEPEPGPLTAYRSALHEAQDALEVAELVRAFQKLDPADRDHILTLSRRLVAWHN